MKRFSFSLQRLLDYKEQVLDAERTVLSDMNAVLFELTEQLAQMRGERQFRARKLIEIAAQGATVLEIQTHKNYLKTLDEAIARKENQISLQKQAIDKQTDKVRDVKLEITTMEKLREKKLEEYNHLDSKAQELFIEEFVSNAKATEPQGA